MVEPDLQQLRQAILGRGLVGGLDPGLQRAVMELPDGRPRRTCRVSKASSSTPLRTRCVASGGPRLARREYGAGGVKVTSTTAPSYPRVGRQQGAVVAFTTAGAEAEPAASSALTSSVRFMPQPKPVKVVVVSVVVRVVTPGPEIR